MGRRKLLLRLAANACRRNKLVLLCALGILGLLVLNQGTNSSVDWDQYKLLVENFTIPALYTSKMKVKVQPKLTTTLAPDGFSLPRYLLAHCPNRTRSRVIATPRATPRVTPRTIPRVTPRPIKDDEIMVRYSKKRDVMLCPVYKVGSTFWRRVFMMESDSTYRRVQHPYQIPFDKELKGSLYHIGAFHMRNFTFMFTRDPYSRLFSTYVDKLLAPNPYYWKALGEKIVKLTRVLGKPGKRQCGHDVTFPEFIKYVIYSLEHMEDVDPHFVQMEANCRPCDVKYDFIGKMETFAKDSVVCLEKLNLQRVVNILKANGSELSSIDAMLDTLSQPFSFRRNYARCMSFSEAVQRSWKKLQIRGLIGEEPLSLKTLGNYIDGVSLKGLMSRARESRKNSTSEVRKKLKRGFYQEYWQQISVKDLYKLQQLYAMDFQLFNYDPKPIDVFQNRTQF